MTKNNKKDPMRHLKKFPAAKQKESVTQKDAGQKKTVLPDDFFEHVAGHCGPLSERERAILANILVSAAELCAESGLGVDDDSPLADKVALVTNASRGIGASIAVALAESGAHVLLHCSDDEEKALEVQARIKELNRECVLLRADLSNVAEAHDLVSMIKTHHSHIDVLINNPTTHLSRSLEGIDEGIWDKTLNGNLGSAYHLIEAVAPGMIARKWGRIINLTSMMWQIGGGCPSYVASMAGLIGLTRSYAGSLAKNGITVNAITLGLIEGEETISSPPLSPELIPVLRYGDPEEVVIVVLMLACNDYITGQAIGLNGGLFMS